MQNHSRDFLKTEIAIAAIRNGQANAVMDSLYAHLLPEFVKWGKRQFNATAKDIDDVFQEVLIAFYLKVTRHPNLTITLGNIKYYLFGIGRNKLAEVYKERTGQHWLEQYFYQNFANHPDVIAFSWEKEAPFEIERLQEEVATLSPRCADILTRTLLENQNIQQVLVEMGYNGENSTSATKSRCLAELKKRLTARFTPEVIGAWFEEFK